MSSPYHAIDVSWQHPTPTFELIDSSGKTHRLSDFREKVVILYFGYTHCPLVCPTTLADLAQVMRLLGKDATRVQVIFITLDPERDTPDMLNKFTTSFNPKFLGLYGNDLSLLKATKAFGVSYQKNFSKSGSYTLDHSDGIYLLGIRGIPLLLSSSYIQPELMVRDIRMLITVGR